MFQKTVNFLVENEIWFVIPAAFVGIVMPGYLWISVLVILLFWPLRWIKNRRLSIRTAIDIPVLLILLFIPVTLWATPFLGRTSTQVLRLLVGIGLYYAVANWGNNLSRIQILLAGMIVLLLGLTLIAPFGVQWLTTKYPLLPVWLFDKLPNLIADSANPNVMAGYLVILLPLAVGLLLFNWHGYSGLVIGFIIVTILLALIVLVMTQSRGAWLAFLISMSVLLVLRWKRTLLLIIVCGVALVSYIILQPSSSLVNGLMGEGQLGSLDGRLEVWSRAIYLIQDFSVTGVGMGSFMQVVDLLYPFFIFEPGRIEHAHNLYLQVAADLGIPGLIAWSAALGLTFMISWQVYRSGRSAGNALTAGIGAGLICSLISLGIHGIIDAVTWGMVRPAPLVWMIWGLVAASGALFLQKGVLED